MFVDLNTEDETGYPWTYADQASDPSIAVKGCWLAVRPGSAVALAEVIDVGADGLVHVAHCPDRSALNGWLGLSGGAN